MLVCGYEKCTTILAEAPANKSVKSDLIAGVPANKSVKSDLMAGTPVNQSVKSDLIAGVPANKSVKSDLIAGVPVNKSVKSDLMAGVPVNKSVKSDLMAEPSAALPAFAVASAQVAPLSRHLPESLGKGALTGGSQRGIAYVELTFCNAKYYRSLRPGACGGIGRTIMTPTVRLLRAA